MHATHQLMIDAPVERVWELTEDIEAWPTMTATITSVERLDHGPLGVGSRARLKQPLQRATVWTVTDFEPGRRFVWETTTFGLRMVGGHWLEDVDGRCRNTLSVDIFGRGAGLFSALFGRQIRSAIATENAGFRTVAESADH